MNRKRSIRRRRMSLFLHTQSVRHELEEQSVRAFLWGVLADFIDLFWTQEI